MEETRRGSSRRRRRRIKSTSINGPLVLCGSTDLSAWINGLSELAAHDIYRSILSLSSCHAVG